MDYKKVHDSIIDRALSRDSVDGYTEKHHILPKSMGGSNAKSNLVTLTAREHYIIHWLLFKMHRSQEMAFAWHRMTHGKTSVKRYVSHTFTYARKTRAAYVSAFLKGKSLTEEHKDRLSAAKSGKTYADMGRGESSLKGRKLSESHKAKLAITSSIRKHTDESKRKCSATKFGENNPSFLRNNKSGVVGVSYSTSKGKWCASIKWHGSPRIYLGAFNDFSAAVEARRNAEKQYPKDAA